MVKIKLKRNIEDPEMISILDDHDRLFAVCHGDLLSYEHGILLDEGYVIVLNIPEASELEKNENK